jgi:opacity protein-like surface antigen
MMNMTYQKIRHQRRAVLLAIIVAAMAAVPAVGQKLPTVSGVGRLSLPAKERSMSQIDRLRSLDIEPPRPKSTAKISNDRYWYGGASAGISFLGDLDITQSLGTSINDTVSSFNVQFRNLGDILGQLDRSVFSDLARTTILDRPILVPSTVDRLSPAQVTSLIDRLSTNPNNAEATLTEFGISATDFGIFLKQIGTRLTRPNAINNFPLDFQNNPAQIAALERLGRDLNSIGELVRRSQPLGSRGNIPNTNSQPIISRSLVRSSSGTGHAAFIGYKFNDFRIETEFFSSSNTLDRAIGSNPVDNLRERSLSGNLSNSTLLLNGAYDFPVDWTIKPFLSAGLGYSWLTADNLNLGGGSVTTIDGQPIFSCQLKAGFALPLSDRLDLLFQYRYLTTGEFTARGNLLNFPIVNRFGGVNLQTLELGAKFGL